MSHFDLIAFDADDTLWENEAYYAQAQEAFRQLLAPYAPAEVVNQTLYETEMGNLSLYGYGTKGFMLSLVETAIHLSHEQISAAEIQKVIYLGKQMLSADIEVLANVKETLDTLAHRYTLMLLTKGDLLHQQKKLNQSGLKPYFRHVEIVDDKTDETYTTLFARFHLRPERFLMVGNSLRSDILPVVTLGAQAVYIPHHITWAHEHVETPNQGSLTYHQLENIRQLPDLLARLEQLD